MRSRFASRAFILSLLLSFTATFAAPVVPSSRARIATQKRRLDARQDGQQLTEPVTFQTVTTTQTPVATILETCQVTLTPNGDGASVREDKSCTYQVTPIGAPSEGDLIEQPPPPPEGGNDGNQDTGQPPPPEEATETPPLEDDPDPDQPPSTDVNLVPIGTATDVPAGEAPTTSTDAPTDNAATPDATPAPPPFSEVGLSSVPLEGAPTTAAPDQASDNDNGDSSAADPEATLTTATVTNADGSLSTVVTTASAAAAEVPGRTLAVLPIGLGVFAGISVIALIVVGLVTYERTKYRKAFRQRKMAETGANMGYGGMAEIR